MLQQRVLRPFALGKQRKRLSRDQGLEILARLVSREGSLIDLGVEQGIVRKAGAWYTYEGDQLGQGKENARTFLKENPDVAAEIEKKILEKLGVGQGAGDAAGGLELPPVDF